MQIEKLNQKNQVLNYVNELFDGLTLNTKRTYEGNISQFLDYFNIGINDLKNISVIEIQKYINFLKENYKLNTVNIKLNSIRKLFKVLEKFKVKNVFNELKDLKIKSAFNTNKGVSREKTLSRPEISKLVGYYESKKNYTMSLLIKCLAENGLRISEALNIKYSDIEKINENLYQIRITGKGSKERFVLINEKVYSKMLDIRKGEYVFSSKYGNRLDRKNVTMSIKKTGKKIFDRNISCHCLRHSFATNMIEMLPGKVKAISKYLGHSTTSITYDLYVHQSLSLEDLSVVMV